MGRSFFQVRSADGAGLEGNTVRQICDEPRACGSDGLSGQSCHARIYDRLGNLHLLVSAGAMTQAFTMGNMEVGLSCRRLRWDRNAL